nr:YwaF family protein [Akkermansiaceae bacterium]
MDLREFQPFGPSHWLAIAVTVAVGVWLLRWFRHPGTSAAAKLRMRRIMAAILGTAVVMDPLLTGLRYADTPDLSWRLIRENSLPLYLCDVVSLLLAWALVSGRQRLAEVGYFWALAGTTQGLLTPTLYFDWKSPEYYAFFAQHGGAPVAAVVLV